MKWVRSLLSSSSDVSMMRVMSLLSLLIAGVLAFKGMDTSVSVFVYAAFGGKFAQKYLETSNAPSPKP